MKMMNRKTMLVLVTAAAMSYDSWLSAAKGSAEWWRDRLKSIPFSTPEPSEADRERAAVFLATLSQPDERAFVERLDRDPVIPWYSNFSKPLPFDPSKPMGNELRPDQRILRFSVAIEGDDLLAEIQPREIPSAGTSREYRINLLRANFSPSTTFVWGKSGASLYRWSSNGSFAGTEGSEKCRFENGPTFRVRAPVSLFPELADPIRFGALTLQLDQNRWEWSTPQEAIDLESDVRRRWALDLLIRLLGSAPWPGDPFLAVAIALNDALLFRMADKTTRARIVLDGREMARQALATDADPASAERRFRSIPASAKLWWANRCPLYGAYYGVDYPFLTGGRLNEEGYRFMVLDPRSLELCRQMALEHGFAAKDLRALETWLNAQVRYRRLTLEEIRDMARPNRGNEFWERTLRESEEEAAQGDTNWGVVCGKTVPKGQIWSPSRQIEQLRKSGMYFGNCNDVAILAAAFATSLGIPTAFLSTSAISAGKFRVDHTFPIFYNSESGRWMDTRWFPIDEIHNWAKSPGEAQRVLTVIERPGTGTLRRLGPWPLLGDAPDFPWFSERAFLTLRSEDAYKEWIRKGISIEEMNAILLQ